MINFIEKGDVLDYTAAAAVKSGAAVVLVNHIGVACGDIALGKTGAVNVSGVYELAAETGVAFAIGDDLYWDAANSRLTKTTGTVKAGWAWAAKAADATTAQVRL